MSPLKWNICLFKQWKELSVSLNIPRSQLWDKDSNSSRLFGLHRNRLGVESDAGKARQIRCIIKPIAMVGTWSLRPWCNWWNGIKYHPRGRARARILMRHNLQWGIITILIMRVLAEGCSQRVELLTLSCCSKQGSRSGGTLYTEMQLLDSGHQRAQWND